MQLLAILLAVAVLYWFFTSGLYFDLVKAFSEWYARQITFPSAPTPAP